MKAAQITHYSKDIRILVNDIPVPVPGETEVLVKVKAAAVNPLEILTATGGIKLIQSYRMPLTLGNECSGTVEATGSKTTGFRQGDKVYARLPISKIGAFAEYVAVDRDALAPMPKDCGFIEAAAIPLTGLTAYQAITEELEAGPGSSLLITGGSGSFGEMAVPVAKALGLNVTVTGNAKAEGRMRELGADRYIDYRKADYWKILSDMDYVIDTLGPAEFAHSLSVLRKGGRLLSLRNVPNREFAVRNRLPLLKRLLFSAAGAANDREARKQGKEYRFMFVRSDGQQLRRITEIVEKYGIRPQTDPTVFDIDHTQDAVKYLSQGHPTGKVIIGF